VVGGTWAGGRGGARWCQGTHGTARHGGKLRCANFSVACYPHDRCSLPSVRSKYSQSHLSLHPDSERYWRFSLDELARYDVPAQVDHVLQVRACATASPPVPSHRSIAPIGTQH